MTNPYPDAPTIDFLKVGGQKLRTAIWKGNGNKRPLLFFNGIGANLEVAAPLGLALPDRDIITFDLPGIGGSPDPVFPYRPWWVAQAAKTVLVKNGYTDKVDVMGVSWGGGAAQQFAFQYKNRVNNLVLVATSAGSIMVPGNVGALSKMASPKRYMDGDFMKAFSQTLYGESPEAASLFAEHVIPPSVKGYMFQLSAMAGWSSLPFLPFMPQPTLVMAGDNDAIVPLANARILNFMIPNSQLHVVPNGGHLFLLSRSDEIVPVLTDFLDFNAPEEAATKQSARA